MSGEGNDHDIAVVSLRQRALGYLSVGRSLIDQKPGGVARYRVAEQRPEAVASRRAPLSSGMAASRCLLIPTKTDLIATDCLQFKTYLPIYMFIYLTMVLYTAMMINVLIRIGFTPICARPPQLP